MDYRLAEVADGTQVSVDADVTLAGAIAQFGRTSLIQETANILVRDFAGALEARLAPTAAAPPAAAAPAEIGAGSVGLRALWAWLKSLVGNLFGTDQSRR